ncbi:MAG: hypothetical protein H6Q65_1157 [Firmicutes bacterium]|nr:hypothetical protein [Bacillota bacterium]
MKVTAAKFIPAVFREEAIQVYAKAQIDGELWLLNMIVRVDGDGTPKVHFPAKDTRTTNTKRRVHYHIEGQLREDIFAAVIEQYELYVNCERRVTGQSCAN